VLKIEAAAWRALLGHAGAAAPEEACGILLGRQSGDVRVAVLAAACRNVYSGDRQKHFLIDPSQQAAVQRQAREAGLEILGFYHSHHNGSAALSEEDRRMAHPHVSNLVLAFRGGVFLGARSWRIGAGGEPTEEPVEVEGVTRWPQPASESADGS
jgi:proteasome lid subunit RPN8/RPN11